MRRSLTIALVLAAIASGAALAQKTPGAIQTEITSTLTPGCVGCITASSISVILTDITNSFLSNVTSATTTGTSYTISTQGTGVFNLNGLGGEAISGSAPTSCTSTGTGSSPSCAFVSGSNNSNGQLAITTGTSPVAVGTFTIAFSNSLIAPSSTNIPACNFTYDDTGTAWSVSAISLHVTGANTTSITGSWNNNNVNLSNSSPYRISYHCFGK